MTASTFRDLIRDVSPPWLARFWGERYMYAPGLVLDALWTWAQEGLEQRFPDLAHDEALPYMGRDRRIRRGFIEPANVYRQRLKRWKRDHQTAGNALALMQQLKAYMFGFDVRIRCVNDRGTWQTLDPDGTFTVQQLAFNWNWDNRYPASARTRFWVIIYPLDSGIWEKGGHWGDGSRWGDGREWGTTATREQSESIRAIVKEWKPQGTRCPYIIIAFDPASFDPTHSPGDPLPDGSWGRWGKDVAGVRVRSRLSSARYWKGSS
jgi:hypothetical protein